MQLLKRLRRQPPAEEPAGSLTMIIGLGNPGRQYARNRHNVGFQIADRFAADHELTFGKMQHNAMIAAGRLDDKRLIIAKPQTYMNESGRSVGALVKFYKPPLAQVLVIFDDLDLPFGAIRLRADGGAGGHNGMRSIISHLGGNQFPRLRVGIGRPPGRMDPAAFVLQDFNREEETELPQVFNRAVQAIEAFIRDGITTAMNKFNSNQSGDTS